MPNQKQKIRRILRKELVQVIYSFMLFNKKVNHLEAFEEYDFLDKEQIIFLKYIESNFDFFKSTISKFCNASWPWDRLDPLVRAILLVGCAELLKIPQPKIVINEAINMVKLFFPQGSQEVVKYSKFVNAVLQNIYKLIVVYETQNATKKQN